MGFLSKAASLNFNKVTISLWFRVPQASIDAAAEKFLQFNDGGDYWYGTLPLLTWGTQSTANRLGISSQNDGFPPDGYSPFVPLITHGAAALDSVPQGCGYIALRCGDPDNEGARLETYIPTENAASGTNLIVDVVSYELIPDEPPSSGGTVVFTNGDLSAIEESYNDWFGGESRDGPDVTADEWHHLLISWDLTGGSGSEGGGEFGDDPENCITASSVMYAALDGVNLTGSSLPMFWPGGSFDVNGHVSYVAANYAGVPDRDTGPASVALTVGTILTNPISIPGPAEVDVVGSGGTTTDEPVLNCQRAELQIFTDICLDTSIEANVLAFRTADGNPAAPSLASALMGKSPEVYFRTVANWQGGVNVGTADDFTPTGTIEGYTPGP